jgi:ATP-dependent exoDNAse (exonuclease V) alpha subunit
VVVDETSMADVILANKLIKAVPPGAHLLLVGDVDQLPSAGARGGAAGPAGRRVAPGGAADQDLPASTAVRHRGQRRLRVIPPVTSSWMMLQRNLLYTGVTRARKLVVLAGTRHALAAAIRTKGTGRRHTALAHRLRASTGR